MTLNADLTLVNGTSGSGTATATATVKNQKIEHIEVHASGLVDSVHAVHIHYGEDAANECPTAEEHDANDDGRVNTVEGIPAYGPVVVSLNTTGDTTPRSFLDISRFPVARDGRFSYSRDGIEFTDVSDTGYAGGGTAREIATSVREGEGVVVVHGTDYDVEGGTSGSYDFAAGKSELDPSLPAEATAICGVLK